MKENTLKIITSFILVFIAGFADTATFTAGGEIFSAHVTGNFVVFGYKLATEPGWRDYTSLLTFPVFILAVYCTGILNNKIKSERILYLIMGSILCFAALLSYAHHEKWIVAEYMIFGIVMLIVFAMGIQNAVNKIYSKSTFGPTTVMTGNVTNATLNFCKAYTSKSKDDEKKEDFMQILIMMIGFLLGCFLGAKLAFHYGLMVLAIPGILALIYFGIFYKSRATA